MEVVYNTKFLLRRGTAEAWEHNNPILSYGEPGYDSTNYGLKIGDGKTKWKDLNFLSASKEQIEEAINKYFEENPGSGTGGAPGKDGVSATHKWQGTTLIITSASGTSSANLQGPAGPQGIQGPKGEQGPKGDTPQKYVDYWTDKDKQEIISELPKPDLTGYATEEFVNKQIADAQLGGDGEINLSAYYTKSETNAAIKTAVEAIELMPGPQGEQGPQGEKGETPQKGKDYFTEEDIQEIVDKVTEDIPDISISGGFVAQNEPPENISLLWIDTDDESSDNTGSSGNIDLTGYATEKWVSNNYQVKGEYLTEIPEEYAKSSEIPTRPEDIGAQPAGEYLTSVPDGYATQEYVKNKIAEASLSGGEVDLSGYATKEELPTKTSQLVNDSGYLTEHIDISGKLDASKLPEAIDIALAQAKASGEFDGADGEDGATFTPHVDSNGNLSWSNDKGLANPATVNIKGPQGNDGKDGQDGQNGYTPVKGVDYFDGKDGEDGKNGVSATHSWSGTTLTVTSASGTSSANLKGDKGDRGDTGATGKSAYLYAVENGGYNGTPTAFGEQLASIENKLSMELLWENASPSDAFAATPSNSPISLGDSVAKYARFMIELVTENPCIVRKDVNCYQPRIDMSASGDVGYVNWYYRSFKITNDGLTVGNCYHMQANSSSGITKGRMTTTSYLKPYRVWGIGGVS